MLLLHQLWEEKVLEIIDMKDRKYSTRFKLTDNSKKKTEKYNLKRHKMTIDGKNYPVNSKNTNFKISLDFKKPMISQRRLKNNLKYLSKVLSTTLERNVMVKINKTILNDQLNLSEETIVQWI